MVDAELFESVPNFSEGRDARVIEAIATAGRKAHLLDVDSDRDHHRAVISLAGSRIRLVETLVQTVGAAAERIDLRSHVGVHPRVGATDVVPIVPLGATSLESCRTVSHSLGERLWAELRIPVYFYGDGERWTLADIRAGRAQPDLGGPGPHPTAGAVCVGARRLLVAFNVLLPGMTLTAARALAGALRESAGGLRGVQALAFQLPGGEVQLSMNLFRPDETGPQVVIDELVRRGVFAGSQQVVGLCPAAAANDAAAGRILEARIGAAVARAGAQKCRALGDHEHVALAKKLEVEAASLAMLGMAQPDLLAGAERCFALGPVLGAAGVLEDELAGLSLVAAGGLRSALGPETEAGYGPRVAALDRGLAGSV